jgi:anti-sigma B factor antagonist
MSQEPQIVTVVVLGEIDIASAPSLERTLRDYAAEGCGLLEVDLDGVRFMDCSGINLLLRTAAYLEERQATLRVRCTIPALRRIFALTFTDRHLNVMASRPSADELWESTSGRRHLFDCQRNPPRAAFSSPWVAVPMTSGLVCECPQEVPADTLR